MSQNVCVCMCVWEKERGGVGGGGGGGNCVTSAWLCSSNPPRHYLLTRRKEGISEVVNSKHSTLMLTGIEHVCVHACVHCKK